MFMMLCVLSVHFCIFAWNKHNTAEKARKPPFSWLACWIFTISLYIFLNKIYKINKHRQTSGWL